VGSKQEVLRADGLVNKRRVRGVLKNEGEEEGEEKSAENEEGQNTVWFVEDVHSN
jgi:hypothetical protein